MVFGAPKTPPSTGTSPTLLRKVATINAAKLSPNAQVTSLARRSLWRPGALGDACASSAWVPNLDLDDERSDVRHAIDHRNLSDFAPGVEDRHSLQRVTSSHVLHVSDSPGVDR